MARQLLFKLAPTQIGHPAAARLHLSEKFDQCTDQWDIPLFPDFRRLQKKSSHLDKPVAAFALYIYLLLIVDVPRDVNLPGVWETLAPISRGLFRYAIIHIFKPHNVILAQVAS